MQIKLSKILSLLLASAVFTSIWNTAFSVSASERLDKISFTYSEEFIPVYTVGDLYNIRNNLDGNYRLMNDIDLTEATAKGGDLDYMGCGWLPIGMSNSGTTREYFTGIFDGGNYTIKGMRIETNDDISGGLFLWVSGEIRNLNMIGGTIKAEKGSIGSIAAANHGSIENCHVEITIDTSASMVGGIVGDKLWNNFKLQQHSKY